MADFDNDTMLKLLTGPTAAPPVGPGPQQFAANLAGKGSDLDGPYLPDNWNQLTDQEKELMEKNGGEPVFGNDFNSSKDLQGLIDKHGAIQVWPGEPAVQQFLREADPSQYERFNWPGYGPNHKPTGDNLPFMDHTIFIRRKEPLTS
jgi:hypothetical protein